VFAFRGINDKKNPLTYSAAGGFNVTTYWFVVPESLAAFVHPAAESETIDPIELKSWSSNEAETFPDSVPKTTGKLKFALGILIAPSGFC
jgi:hypothetical protein